MFGFLKNIVSALLVFLLLGATMALAQEVPPTGNQQQSPANRKVRQQGARKQRDPVATRMAQLDTKFNLSEAQKAQIVPLLQDQMQQMQAIRQDATLTPEQKKARIAELNKTNSKQIHALLTTEQLAQAKKPRGPMTQNPQNRLQKLDKNLNLSDEQKSKLQPLFEDETKQIEALKADTSLTPAQKKGKAKVIRKGTLEEMSSVLTPEQQEKMKGAARKQQAGLMRPKSMSMGRLQWMGKSLNLSDDQKSKLQPLLQDEKQQLNALKADTSLTPQQRKEKLRSIRTATDQQVTSLLTPEQQKRMREDMAKRNLRKLAPAPAEGSGVPPVK